MNVFEWAEKKIHNMKWWDMSMVKTVSLLFGLIIGAYVSGFVQDNITVLVVLTAALWAFGAYRFFFRY
ncbi:MAG: hypothetical protein OXR66_04735 [Candidatus Woesearchaeota archaeon]|nr:hypothetical protein [Candidatus Woesearchaeota archaeon]